MIFLYRIVCLFLAFMLLMPLAVAEEKYTAFPEPLRITQKYEKKYITQTSYSMLYYPKTCQPQVDAQLREALDRMAAEGLEYLPAKTAIADEAAMLDGGATVYRTGKQWASFLLSVAVLNGGKQLYMDFDSYAYDMLTGERLTIDDVVLESGFALVQAEAEKQLAAYFPQYAVDEEKLAALCDVQQLRAVDFTLSPAFLQLHFASEALYDHAGVIMHVRIPYALLHEHLTQAALEQTDNSRYKLVALTYDDGPTRKRTLAILRTLRSGGLNATFFVVGDRIRGASDLIMMEHNAGFAIASHNYEHVYPSQMSGKVIAYRDKLNSELQALTGKGVSMMRAPGGHEEIYIEEKVGIPLIHWTLASKDGKSTDFEPWDEAARLVRKITDGSIVLMHDLRLITEKYSAYLPQMLNERGYLCVTVEELFALRGIPLEPNTLYKDEALLP